MPPDLIFFVARTQTKETKSMTAVMLRGLDSAPEASPRFSTRSTTALYLAVPWLEIHNLPMMESFHRGAFFEAARCAVHLPDTSFEEGTTVSVV
jgi:hypothetical protein